MPENGIRSFSAYVPRLRMDRASIAAAHAWALPALKGIGKGERAFCSWDEDSITMSVEAVRGLPARSRQRSRIGSMRFASTTPVFSDLQNASLVASAAGLGSELSTLDVTGSLRAGTSALIRALESSKAADSIVVAADDRHAKPGSVQEMHYGAGSVALLVGAGDVIARFAGSASTATQFVDHFRAEGQKYDYQWEERWVRDEGYLKIVPETVERLLESTGTLAGCRRLLLPALDDRGHRGRRREAVEAQARGRGRPADRALWRYGRSPSAVAAGGGPRERVDRGRRSCWLLSAPVAMPFSSRRLRRSRVTSPRPGPRRRSTAA